MKDLPPIDYDLSPEDRAKAEDARAHIKLLRLTTNTGHTPPSRPGWPLATRGLTMQLIGLGSAVRVNAGGALGYVTRRQESIGSEPLYYVVAEKQSDGERIAGWYPAHEVALLPPGESPGFDLTFPEASETPPESPGAEVPDPPAEA